MLLQFNNTVTELREIGFSTEKEMQHFCERNMELLLGLRFVATEFAIAQFRFDSVAYDESSNAFIIIEYKNDKNFSVVDQGYSYISTALNHKADLVLKYNQVFNAKKGVSDFDWTQVRVYFIAPQYTKYQINSINFTDLPMELYKIKRYEQGIVQFEQIRPASTAASIKGYTGIGEKVNVPGEGASIKAGTGPDSGNESAGVIVYDEEYHLKRGSDFSNELYAELRDYVLSLDDDISIKPTKLYIGFQQNRRHLLDMKIQTSSVVIWLNTEYGKLDDPKGLIKDVTHIGHHGNGDCQIKVEDRTNLGYIKDMIFAYYVNNA